MQVVEGVGHRVEVASQEVSCMRSLQDEQGFLAELVGVVDLFATNLTKYSNQYLRTCLDSRSKATSETPVEVLHKTDLQARLSWANGGTEENTVML